jgi:hypothetical protein
MEPLSIIAISAATGGIAGKFIEKAWDSGEKWIQSYFKDHKEKAQQKATENSMDFLNELAQRVKLLEDNSQIKNEQINQAQDHPDFSAMLQKALLTAAQTDNSNKHKLLARLVSERLKAKPESILALGSKMACDVISYMTVNQIMLLGLLAIIYSIRPNPFPPEEIKPEQFQDWVDNWLTTYLLPYQTIDVKLLDIIHLESLSCLKRFSFAGHGLNQLFSQDDYKFDFQKMKAQELKGKINEWWNNGVIQQVDLTTVGYIIGVSITDLIMNTTTNFVGWD